MKYFLPQRSQRNLKCFKHLRCRTENSLKILSYQLLLVNGTSWILTLEISTVIRYFARIFYFFIEYSIYSIYDALSIKYIHRLQLDFSHLRIHNFRHNFEDTMKPLYSCSLEIERTEHYFRRCHSYVTFRITLVN